MRIVLFGATGYTGRLTADALARRRDRSAVTLVLAGRDRQRLTELAEAIDDDVEVAKADATDERQVRDLVAGCDVVVATVGPFVRLGMPAAGAAAAEGVTYLDSTGEPAFVRRVRDELTAPAEHSGAALVPAFGYDYVPGNLAAELVLREEPDARRVRVGYFVRGRGGASSGTAASGAGMMVDPAFAWRGGRLVGDRMASRTATFDVAGRAFRAFSLAGTEHLWLPPRHPGLTDVEVYLGWAGRMTRAAQLTSHALRAVTAVPGGRTAALAVASRVVRRPAGGPDADSRAQGRTLVVAETLDAAGVPTARVQLDGPNPYELTADLLAWAALEAAAKPPQVSGVIGPADLFGLDSLVAGCADLGLAATG